MCVVTFKVPIDHTAEELEEKKIPNQLHSQSSFLVLSTKGNTSIPSRLSYTFLHSVSFFWLLRTSQWAYKIS